MGHKVSTKSLSLGFCTNSQVWQTVYAAVGRSHEALRWRFTADLFEGVAVAGLAIYLGSLIPTVLIQTGFWLFLSLHSRTLKTTLYGCFVTKCKLYIYSRLCTCVLVPLSFMHTVFFRSRLVLHAVVLAIFGLFLLTIKVLASSWQHTNPTSWSLSTFYTARQHTYLPAAVCCNALLATVG